MDLSWLLAPPLPDAIPRQRLLYQRLRAAIADGRLPPGLRLPASRQLAAELGIARNSVLFAYELLLAEGALQSSRQGTRVAPQAGPADTRATPAPLPPLSRRSATLLGSSQAPGRHGLFAPGAVDTRHFPFRAWRACLERAWQQATPRQLDYLDGSGEPALRHALAGYLASLRGLPVRAEQIIVTAGTQSALDLCARLLADAGECAWVENPGYIAARSALQMAGLQLQPIPVDAEGMAPTPTHWAEHPPRLLLATPAHQYPGGEVMSLARRRQLLAGARQAGAWIIEDDYDAEFAPRGPALPALFGLEADAPVVYTGTFSKTLYPGLRIGYLVLPEPLAAPFARAAATLQRPGQGVEQAALAEFIARGHYSQHLRRMRRLYRARQQRLRQALEQSGIAHLGLQGGAAGLHLTLHLPATLADVAVARAAAPLGLAPRPLSLYALPPLQRNGLVLGYGSLDEALIPGAVARLAQACRTVAALAG